MIGLKRTHTFVTLEVTEQTWDEIYNKLKEAGYEHTFIKCSNKVTIDMQGIGLQKEEKPIHQFHKHD